MVPNLYFETSKEFEEKNLYKIKKKLTNKWKKPKKKVKVVKKEPTQEEDEHEGK